ncbi:MAG TPA: tetratricopeptide repeat-containing glycosyltransferase family protein [Rhizomicrobium sp.]|nr:tetratricopeptide repeat-containing glycosyltransferase family protein [Rhizomicrobium sp.]
MNGQAIETPDARTYFSRGLALHKAGRHEEAEALCKQALERFPRHADLWNLRGVNFRVAKQYARAAACLREGLALAPRDPSLWSNLGNVLKDLKHCETAAVCHRRSLELQPDSVSTLHNLGIALSEGGRDSEALEVYERALAIEPGNADVRWDRALSRLRTGNYAGGWTDYEARIERGDPPKRDMPGKRWNGERYDGKRLLIVSEQGLGDTIWVARYFPMAKKFGGELIVECRPEVAALIESMGMADRIVFKRDPLPDADYHILQCSLPSVFAHQGAPVPTAPYLAAPAGHGERIAAVMKPGKGRLKVGIVWGGSVTYGRRADRDAPLAMFLQWFALPGVQLYSLQKGPQEEDLNSLPAGAPIVNLTPHTKDFFETAAAVAQLDLVLMTDTAVAHLAGALGRPVWVLLNRVPHWLWQLDGGDCFWYPSMRLFRQRAWGDWGGAFDQAAAALLELGNARRGRA